MSGAVVALGRSVRMSDSDYPGVLRCFGGALRLVVSPDGRRYRLQPLADDGVSWGSPGAWGAARLSTLLRNCAAVVEGLALACEGLPDLPLYAVPDLVASRAALLAEITADRARAAVAAHARRAAFFAGKVETRAAEATPRSSRRGETRKGA